MIINPHKTTKPKPRRTDINKPAKLTSRIGVGVLASCAVNSWPGADARSLRAERAQSNIA
jgi:hypothetical protein